MDREINFDARIDPLADTSIHPSSWFITHGLGTPAAGMFTEVTFPEGTADLSIQEQAEIVRTVAAQVYGNRWAFHYPPDDYHDVIENYSLVRRERITITGIEVY